MACVDGIQNTISSSQEGEASYAFRWKVVGIGLSIGGLDSKFR